MRNRKAKKCKTKGCQNPVLDDGVYCSYCKSENEERKKNIFLWIGGALISLFFGIVTGAFKKTISLVVKGISFFRG